MRVSALARRGRWPAFRAPPITQPAGLTIGANFKDA